MKKLIIVGGVALGSILFIILSGSVGVNPMDRQQRFEKSEGHLLRVAYSFAFCRRGKTLCGIAGSRRRGSGYSGVGPGCAGGGCQEERCTSRYGMDWRWNLYDGRRQ